MIERNITVHELAEFVRKHHFYFIMGVACHPETQLFDLHNHPIEEFDKYFRPSMEALILHAWYCDLWVSTCHTFIISSRLIVLSLQGNGFTYRG